MKELPKYTSEQIAAMTPREKLEAIRELATIAIENALADGQSDVVQTCAHASD